MRLNWLEEKVNEIHLKTLYDKDDCKTLFLISGDVKECIEMIKAFKVVKEVASSIDLNHFTLVDFYHIIRAYNHSGVRGASAGESLRRMLKDVK